MYVYCLYIPHYPAWAHGRLVRARAPVVVVSGDRVIAHTRSRHLRDIEVGDRADRVVQLCPQALIRVRDIGLERTCWEEVIREVNRITPFIAQTAAPFLFFSEAAPLDVRALALRLSVQVGRGDSGAAARLAAVRSATGNVIELGARRWAGFLSRFDVDGLSELDFPEDMLEQLRLFGFKTLADVRRLTERHLGAQFGPEGRRLYEMLHPAEETRIPLYAPPPFIEESYEFEEPIRPEPGPLEGALKACIDRAVAGLGPYRCQRLRIGVALEQEEAPRFESRVLSIPRNHADTLFRLAAPLLQDLLLKVYTSGAASRLAASVSVCFESLRMPAVRQESLFDERPALLGAVHGVHRRYPGMLRHAHTERNALFEEDEVTFEAIDAPSLENAA